ncbi:MAG: GAF domain-containing protein [Pseudomonadota bacterium]
MTTAPDQTLSQLAEVAGALAMAGQPQAGFAALDRTMNQVIGHKLFTILLLHSGSGEAERLYTNQPQVYPVGGRKPLIPNFWTDHVLRGQQSYIGRTYDDIRAVFFDHELIRSLGCESVLNIPVILGRQTLGTINLLHEADWYKDGHLEIGRVFAGLAVPGLAMLQQRP